MPPYWIPVGFDSGLRLVILRCVSCVYHGANPMDPFRTCLYSLSFFSLAFFCIILASQITILTPLTHTQSYWHMQMYIETFPSLVLHVTPTFIPPPFVSSNAISSYGEGICIGVCHIEYEETFVLVDQLITVRSILTISTIWNWKFFFFFFLSRWMLRLCSLMETLLKSSTYMQPPLLYRDPPNKVIYLCCVLYNSNMQLELGFPNSIAPSHNLVSLLAHMTCHAPNPTRSGAWESYNPNTCKFFLNYYITVCQLRISKVHYQKFEYTNP